MAVARGFALFVSSVSRASLAAIVSIGVAGLAGGCTPAPAATFEDFYAATVAGDAATVRALLCAEARAPLVAVDDATLVAAFAVVKVVRRVTLSAAPPGADGSVAVVIEDAVGATTTARLRPDPAAPRGWCVTGVADGEAPQDDR